MVLANSQIKSNCSTYSQCDYSWELQMIIHELINSFVATIFIPLVGQLCNSINEIKVRGISVYKQRSAIFQGKLRI